MWGAIQTAIITLVLFVLIMTFGIIVLRMLRGVYLATSKGIKEFKDSIDRDTRDLLEGYDVALERMEEEQKRIAQHIADLEAAARNGDLIAYDEWKRLTERN